MPDANDADDGEGLCDILNGPMKSNSKRHHNPGAGHETCGPC
jgi:hypothetical protein